MMNFDCFDQLYPSSRYPVMARRGMVCTGSALASAAGLEILRQGGNAMDAAIATAAALTVAALAFSCIPVYRYQYATAWIPIAVGCLGVLLAAYFFWFQPVRMQKRAAAVFQKNRFWQQRCKISFYRDSVCCETAYEKISGYWSDYYACYECPAYLVVAGGWDRHLLIVDKKQLSPGQREAVSAHMREQFANRYLWAKQ